MNLELSFQEFDAWYRINSNGEQLFGALLNHGVFDGIWATALALNQTLTEMKSNGKNK